jgi:hypothetical protein
MILRSFYFRLLFLSLSLAVLTFLIYRSVSSLQYENFAWFSLLFFVLVTLLTFSIALNGLKKNTGHGFVASVNGTVLLKIFLSIAFIIVYILLARPKGPAFIFPFFVFYIVFTFFEVRELLKAQKILLKKKDGDER